MENWLGMKQATRLLLDAEHPTTKFTFGTCTVPDGKRGKWTINTFDLENDARLMMNNLRALRDNPIMYCPPGRYRRLAHKDMGVVMSNTPMEIKTAIEAFHHATGSVLINGLGLGMVLEGILTKPDVTHVTVIELDPDVIELVAPHFKKDGRVQIINADAYTWVPPKGVTWDYAWHDIWNSIDDEHLPLMAKLTRKYSRKAKKQGVWSREEARRQRREANRLPWR